MSSKPITGRQVFFFVSGAFAIVIGVNLTMAYYAVSTFPGLEVKNSYVASQQFNDKLKTQLALGWTVVPTYADGVLEIAITDEAGTPVEAQQISGILGRATHDRADTLPSFTYANGVFSTPAELDVGNWNFRMQAVSVDGTPFEQRVVIHVKTK
ncbi:MULTISPECIES: FixH family protein [Falsihalocynthiibacter]|jgi:nitrogen fixation protein FixH|uniref:Nitrogen fixation protein FixH n=1 Tax=Falsihalocynthiibacter arcticus TaxID=1579316 RepID=A0A126UZ15_9RHOB|nr:FixH family protein [Falsihalocynthiibacter arcticus]AML51322.1 nitrogen fixation protein FixH [Falsihalocynthiibacter arcticus]